MSDILDLWKKFIRQRDAARQQADQGLAVGFDEEHYRRWTWVAQAWDDAAAQLAETIPCPIPPEGWRCTRGYHPEGPCAAVRVRKPVKPVGWIRWVVGKVVG